MKQQSVAVILPCRNEEAAVGATVTAFRAALPHAAIYVFDNNSTDNTVNVARAAGAIVRTELTPGKGNVVRRSFADIDADVYVMADGDATYDAAAAPTMIQELIERQLDMVVGVRSAVADAAFRPGHRLGNAILTRMLSHIFGRSFSDVLSGYRVFSRRFVKSFPALSEGFEVETEISIHALGLHMPVAEIETAYKVRPEGSKSKLSPFRDGCRILLTILTLFRIERPMLFFGIVGTLLGFVSIVIAAPLAITYAEIGLVPRLPTAVLSTGLMILAFLSFFSGMILDTVVRGRRELRRLAYLALRPPE
ncbi:glycosyltransferase involved in cell wall biosynthesis [Bradyrhizobium sp. USDA 4341]